MPVAGPLDVPAVPPPLLVPAVPPEPVPAVPPDEVPPFEPVTAPVPPLAPGRTPSPLSEHASAPETATIKPKERGDFILRYLSIRVSTLARLAMRANP